MKVELISHTPDAERIIAAAAKICYSSANIDSMRENLDDAKSAYFVNMLLEMGHESAIEHASYTFAVEGVSRALLAQLTRHRIASFSVQSQRYVNLADFKFVTPPSISENSEAFKEFISLMDFAKEKYNKIAELLEEDNFNKILSERKNDSVNLNDTEIKELRKVAKKLANEDARFVLPNACETKIIFTMNARSLFNFFKLRSCNRAQWEIRELAEIMLKKLKEISPVLFAQAGPPCVCENKCSEGKMSCGKFKEIQRKYAESEVKS